MTKIALLLTGQLRTIDLVKYVYFNTLISKYDTDIFLSINLNNNLQTLNKNSKAESSIEKANQIIDFFKPVDYFILNNFDEEWENFKNENHPFELDHEKIMFEQFFIVNKAYSLLKNYQSKTITKYDIIMRLRFDQLIWSGETNILDKLLLNNRNCIYNNENIEIVKNETQNLKITFGEVQNNAIYLLGFGDFCHYKYVNDQFWYHDESLIEIMSNFYNNIYNLSIYCNNNNIGNLGAKIECILYHYLTSLNLNILPSHINGSFVREFQ